MRPRQEGGFMDPLGLRQLGAYMQCDKTYFSKSEMHELDLPSIFTNSPFYSFIHPSDHLELSAVIIRKGSKKAKPHEIRILSFHRL